MSQQLVSSTRESQKASIIEYAVVSAQCRVKNEKYFPRFSYLELISQASKRVEVIAKYEQITRKLFAIKLHEVTCDNYYIVKYLMKSNMTRFFLLTYCIELARHRTCFELGHTNNEK